MYVWILGTRIDPILKITSPLLLLTKILTSVWESNSFPLWMDFHVLIIFISNPNGQHNTSFIFPWDTFAYRKIPFGLNNTRVTFQPAMTFVFHDIKCILKSCIDDLATHSCKRVDHSTHLRLVFERCRYYHIWLNPHKCIFCVRSNRLLGFIVYEHGIMVNPRKVEAII